MVNKPGESMRKVLTAIVCLSFSALAGAQTSSSASSANSQGMAAAPSEPTAVIETSDGNICHRVIPNFMIQCGDPAGNGTGGPGYAFKDEVSSGLTFNQPGRLAMANSGPNTNGSQFFVTEAPYPSLNGHYSIFGQCQDLDVVKRIARLATDPRTDRPYSPPKITHIKIIDPGHPAAATKKSTPPAKPQ